MMREIMLLLILLAVGSHAQSECYRTRDDEAPRDLSWNSNAGLQQLGIQDMFFTSPDVCNVTSSIFTSYQTWEINPPYLYRSCVIQDAQKVQNAFTGSSSLTLGSIYPSCSCVVPEVPSGQFIIGVTVTVVFSKTSFIDDVYSTYGCHVNIATSETEPKKGQNFVQIFHLRPWSYSTDFSINWTAMFIVACVVPIAVAFLVYCWKRRRSGPSETRFGWQQSHQRLFWAGTVGCALLLILGFFLFVESMSSDIQQNFMLFVSVMTVFAALFGAFWQILALPAVLLPIPFLLFAAASIAVNSIVTGPNTDPDVVDPIFASPEEHKIVVKCLVLEYFIAILAVLVTLFLLVKSHLQDRLTKANLVAQYEKVVNEFA